MDMIGAANLWAKEGGLLGLIILALFALLVWMHRMHREDMRLWRDALGVHQKKAEELQRENNHILRELTSVISEMRGRCGDEKS